MRVVFVWWFCGMVAAIMASHKGRRGVGWLLLNLLCGPCALIVALLPSREARERARARAQGVASDYRTCPYCAEAIRVAAVKCRYCHSEVPPLQPALLPVEVFLDNEQLSHAWLTQHPEGFVLQCDRQRRSMIIHRATCAIRHQPSALPMQPGEFLGQQALQVCSLSAHALRAWATRQGSQGKPQTCTECGWEIV